MLEKQRRAQRKSYKEQEPRKPDQKSKKHSRKPDYDPRKMSRSIEDPPRAHVQLFSPKERTAEEEVVDELPDDGLHFIQYLSEEE